MTAHTDSHGARFGMWLFIYTEIMLFGGLFVLYAAYYYRYRQDFISGGGQLELVLGAVNTVALLASSFTVAAAVRAMALQEKTAALVLLGVTALLGLAFLCNKYIEWSHKFAHGIIPGSEHMFSLPRGESVFFGMYFMLTGLHGLHVFIGIVVLSCCLYLCARGRLRPVVLENCSLYWHLVDIIWIFLFPLFYLIP
jgi:cytochrome c oxidase subunit III